MLNSDGSIRWQQPDYHTNAKKYFGAFASDIDLDGIQEVVTSGAVFNHDGTIVWETEGVFGFPAIGDLDGDMSPEIISAAEGNITVLSYDGQLVWSYEYGSRSGLPPLRTSMAMVPQKSVSHQKRIISSSMEMAPTVDAPHPGNLFWYDRIIRI